MSRSAWIERRLTNYRLVATSLSGVIGSGTVPDFQNMVATLDPIMANALTHFNSTLPGGLTLVHTMYRLPLACRETFINIAHRMLDASQFLRAEGFVDTLQALKF
jgi:hypothetical protein